MDCRIFTHHLRSFQRRYLDLQDSGNVPYYDSGTIAIAILSSSQGKDFSSMLNQGHIYDLYPPDNNRACH